MTDEAGFRVMPLTVTFSPSFIGMCFPGREREGWGSAGASNRYYSHSINHFNHYIHLLVRLLCPYQKRKWDGGG